MKFRKPMLAKSYEGNEHHVVFPCFAQPKIDGVRCITDGRRFWSRNGKLFPQENLKHLQVPASRYLIDGELSLPDHADFEDIVSIIKRAGHEDSGQICFNAFDVMTDLPYSERQEQLKRFFEKTQVKILSGSWTRLTTKRAVNGADLFQIHKYFLKRGYEGTMVRSAQGKYESKRTRALLKWKPIQDGEFEIVDVKEAKGKDKGTPVFICCVGRPKDDLTFSARPMGSMKQRQEMWKDRDNLIGCRLTVEYQNLTKYGVPRFPRAKVLRDYE